jgi:hypothetical protein
MVTPEEANALIARLAASNIAIRQIINGSMDQTLVVELAKICDENSKALHDFAAAHPETLGSPII